MADQHTSFNPTERLADAVKSFIAISLSVETKGFLGQTLREDRGLPSVGVSAARRSGVIVDDAGKMRCPPGTPNANQFTDINMSNCMVPSAETAARQAVDVAADAAKQILGGFRRGKVGKKSRPAESVKNADVGFADSNGFLEQRSIKVGNQVASPITGEQRTLSNLDDSVLHVAEGGSLKDVPDDHLLKTIQENTGAGKRFTIIGRGGGVNGMQRMRDEKTGALLGFKYPEGNDIYNSDTKQNGHIEATNEVIGELMAEHFGYEPIPMRIVPVVKDGQYGDYKNGVALISELVHNRHGSVESGRPEENPNIGGGEDLESLQKYGADPKSAIGVLVFDMIIDNPDRHWGNFLIAENDGERNFIPIDNSAAFQSLEQEKGLDRISDARLHTGLQEQLQGMIDRGDEDGLQNAISEIQERLRGIDTDQLRQQITQVVDHLTASSVSVDKKFLGDKYESAVKRLETIRDASPEEVIDKLVPAWRRNAYRGARETRELLARINSGNVSLQEFASPKPNRPWNVGVA